jgi:CRISPR-associated protein Csd1
MSWLPRLIETYDQCKGKEADGSAPLMPICHTTQNAQIEIVLDGAGQFRRASVLEKAQGATLIPCTEASGGRSGTRPSCHPLHDKLQYLAGDYGTFGGEVTSGFAKDPAEPYRDYLKSLSNWVDADPHPKLLAIRAYVQRGHVMEDLVREGVLTLGADSKLQKSWTGEKSAAPAIFKVLAPQQTPDDAFVRWRVEAGDDPNSAPWTDEALITSWIAHYQNTQTKTRLLHGHGAANHASGSAPRQIAPRW